VDKRLIDWSVSQRVLPGQAQSGDLFVVKQLRSGVLVAVIDGLGHGEEAARASHLAAGILRNYDSHSLISLIRLCHEKLQGTRGAVLSAAEFNADENTMTWLGVGNVVGVLLHPENHEASGPEVLLLRGGMLGDHPPRLSASILSLMKGDTLILATDGIRSGFTDGLKLSEHPQEIADQIVRRHWRGNDDALVLVARYCHGDSETKSE
jgi:phosphoserine phosphatase RsbX